MSGPSPRCRVLLDEFKQNSLSLEKMVEVVDCVIKRSVVTDGKLSEDAILRMAMCTTALAAKGSLALLDRKTLLTCFKIFQAHARINKNVFTLFGLCKVSISTLHVRCATCPRLHKYSKEKATDMRIWTPGYCKDSLRLTRKEVKT
jgi:hypothetical protein